MLQHPSRQPSKPHRRYHMGAMSILHILLHWSTRPPSVPQPTMGSQVLIYLVQGLEVCSLALWISWPSNSCPLDQLTAISSSEDEPSLATTSVDTLAAPEVYILYAVCFTILKCMHLLFAGAPFTGESGRSASCSTRPRRTVDHVEPRLPTPAGRGRKIG